MDDDETAVRRPRPTVFPYYPYPVPVDGTTSENDDAKKNRVQYGKEVQKEIIKDLKDLKSEIELFIQTSL